MPWIHSKRGRCSLAGAVPGAQPDWLLQTVSTGPGDWLLRLLPCRFLLVISVELPFGWCGWHAGTSMESGEQIFEILYKIQIETSVIKESTAQVAARRRRRRRRECSGSKGPQALGVEQGERSHWLPHKNCGHVPILSGFCSSGVGTMVPRYSVHRIWSFTATLLGAGWVPRMLLGVCTGSERGFHSLNTI